MKDDEKQLRNKVYGVSGKALGPDHSLNHDPQIKETGNTGWGGQTNSFMTRRYKTNTNIYFNRIN